MLLNTRLTYLLATIAFASSMSPVVAKDYVGTQQILQVAGVRSWEAEARCDGISEPLMLSRAAGTEQWCSRDYPDTCGEQRIEVGMAVCELARAELAEQAEVELAKAAAIAMRPALMQEQIDIEAKLIELQQKRIDLQRKELELQKAQVGSE